MCPLWNAPPSRPRRRGWSVPPWGSRTGTWARCRWSLARWWWLQVALRQDDRGGESLGSVVSDPGGGPSRQPLHEPLQGHLLHHVLCRVPVWDQPPPCLVHQLLGEGEGSVALTDGQRPKTPAMFLRVEAQPVSDGPGDGVVVPLGPSRQTVGRKLRLSC